VARILVVDDERKIRRQIAQLFSEEGHVVDQAERVDQALELLHGAVYDLLITDVRLPDRSGMELLSQARALLPQLAAVVITAYGSISDAVEAMRLGAVDYLQKPFRLEALRLLVEEALRVATLRAEHQYLLDQARGGKGPELVGSSAASRRVRELIEIAARQPSTVLLTGESGTGKELVAEAIHARSGQAGRPLVRVNCPAIPAALFESELFGHLKGAFTDARESRRGKFELAHGGTLFLDEISEIPRELQAKLLRVLEERRFMRLGGQREIEVELRVIAATNRDLEQAVATGRFREDLYYRLKIFPIHLSPLRERAEEVDELVDHLLRRIVDDFHLAPHSVTPAARQRLGAYAWPGNVRELRNVLERGLLLAGDASIDVEHLPTELTTDARPSPDTAARDVLAADAGRDFRDQVDRFQRALLLGELERCGWRKKEAARRLGLSPRALSHYVAKFDLDTER